MAVIDRPVRFDILLPQELADDMQAIEDETGFSRGEIFRRAFYLFKRLKETQLQGGNVILRQNDGSLIEIVGF